MCGYRMKSQAICVADNVPSLCIFAESFVYESLLPPFIFVSGFYVKL